jgi:hypothetical protein
MRKLGGDAVLWIAVPLPCLERHSQGTSLFEVLNHSPPLPAKAEVSDERPVTGEKNQQVPQHDPKRVTPEGAVDLDRRDGPLDAGCREAPVPTRRNASRNTDGR